MTTLTRRRDPDSRDEAWLVFCGDVHVGTIGMGSGNPTGGDQWSWHCGFYPGSNPGDAANGTAADFEAARAALICATMKLIEPRPFADAEIAAFKGSPAEYGAGLKLAIERGWLWMHESGTYVKLTDAGAGLLA